MKQPVFILLLLTLCHIAPAQNYKITWGEEIKIKKGTADLDIVAADNTGLYFTEKNLRAKSYFLIATVLNTNIRLMKMDKNFTEVFDKEYKKELKGLNFHSFQELGNDLYMFATDYEKKTRLFKVYGARIDKNSGDLIGDFAELGSYELESKRDDYEMKMTPVQEGKYFLLVSNISGKDRVSLGVHLLDKSLKRMESAVINLSFDPGLYSLQDVRFTKDKKIILLGKESEEVQVAKKKRKKLVFKQYVMSVYSADGKKEKDVKLDADDRYIISGKLIEQPSGEILLAGFFSNSPKKEDLNGFYLNKVDPVSGILKLSSYKEINSGMLGKSFTDETDADEMTKQEKKEAARSRDEDEENFPNRFVINSVDINPADNSVIITSEVSQYSFYTYTNSTYDDRTKSWRSTTTTVHRFTNRDILVINADQEGKIRWLNAIPKSQVEEIKSTTGGTTTGVYAGYDFGEYFAQQGGMPFYSSYSSAINNNTLYLLLNDHTSNNVNPEYGTKVKTVFNFKKKSNLYGISIDLVSGRMTRKIIASNDNESILLPRHAYVSKNEFFIPSWRLHALAKTKLKFAKVTVK